MCLYILVIVLAGLSLHSIGRKRGARLPAGKGSAPVSSAIQLDSVSGYPRLMFCTTSAQNSKKRKTGSMSVFKHVSKLLGSRPESARTEH